MSLHSNVLGNAGSNFLQFFRIWLPKSTFSDYPIEREKITTRFVAAKGGEKMKDSEEMRIQNQFGGFCTRVLKNEANRIHNGYSRQREWEEPLDHMGPEELSQIAVEDRYFQDDHIFEVLGIPVVVTGDVLAEILVQLPEGKRDIILLSFFLEMTDREIAEYLHIVHQTVSKRRIGILKELRKILEKEGYEWSEL